MAAPTLARRGTYTEQVKYSHPVQDSGPASADKALTRTRLWTPRRPQKTGDQTASSSAKRDRPKEIPASSSATRDRPRKKCQTACKPGSVPPEGGDDHSSGPPIAGRFSRPTRTSGAVNPAKRTSRDVPIWSCSRRGLPCRRRCRRRGGLLPHPFTLAGSEEQAVCFLWRYPSGRPGRRLSAAFSPWSPDFPRREQAPAATARPSDGG